MLSFFVLIKRILFFCGIFTCAFILWNYENYEIIGLDFSNIPLLNTYPLLVLVIPLFFSLILQGLNKIINQIMIDKVIIFIQSIIISIYVFFYITFTKYLIGNYYEPFKDFIISKWGVTLIRKLSIVEKQEYLTYLINQYPEIPISKEGFNRILDNSSLFIEIKISFINYLQTQLLLKQTSVEAVSLSNKISQICMNGLNFIGENPITFFGIFIVGLFFYYNFNTSLPPSGGIRSGFVQGLPTRMSQSDGVLWYEFLHRIAAQEEKIKEIQQFINLNQDKITRLKELFEHIN